MKPQYPLRVVFEGEHERVVTDELDLVTTLEWFDSGSGDQSVRVFDALDRQVSLEIRALKLLRFELVR